MLSAYARMASGSAWALSRSTSWSANGACSRTNWTAYAGMGAGSEVPYSWLKYSATASASSPSVLRMKDDAKIVTLLVVERQYAQHVVPREPQRRLVLLHDDVVAALHVLGETRGRKPREDSECHGALQ